MWQPAELFNHYCCNKTPRFYTKEMGLSKTKWIVFFYEKSALRKMTDKAKKKKSWLFLRPSLICFKCPSSVFFSDLNKTKWPHLFYSDVKINILALLCLKRTKWMCLIVFLSNRKIKTVASSVFWEIKNKNKNLPASSVFQKVAWETLVYFFLA